VLGNRIYRELSNAVAGSQEYMAMEKLHELHQEGRYDLLVLDTPPTRNALDFLDAPRRLSTFIDSRSLQLFMAPSRLGLKFLGRGTGMVFGVMQKLTGIDLLRDLSDFFQSFSGMTEGFRERAEHVNALLADSRTAFVLVTSPRRDAVEEATYFHHRLMDAGLPFSGVVVNRMHPPVPDDGDLGALLDDELAAKVAASLADQRTLAERDRVNLRGLQARMGRKPMVKVPELDGEVHDLPGLGRLNEYLFS
jgi:anion-transporting  ArsA/GET3 family ATPase